MARTCGPCATQKRAATAWRRHGQEEDFAKRLKDMGYEACGFRKELEASSQFYPAEIDGLDSNIWLIYG